MAYRGWLSVALAAGVASPSAAATVEVSVENVRSDRGQLYVALFDARAQRVGREIVSAAPGVVNVTLSGVAPGEYAVKVFHDEDGDGRFDRNIIGLPIEGYGFSNRARALMGPPPFKAMRVEVQAGEAALTTARMSY